MLEGQGSDRLLEGFIDPLKNSFHCAFQREVKLFPRLLVTESLVLQQVFLEVFLDQLFLFLLSFVRHGLDFSNFGVDFGLGVAAEPLDAIGIIDSSKVDGGLLLLLSVPMTTILGLILGRP